MIRSTGFRGALLAAGITLSTPILAQTPANAPAPIPAPASAPPVTSEGDSTSAFQERYAELRTAMQAHDEAAVDKLVAPDFSLTDIRGDSHGREDLVERGGRMGGRGDRQPARADAGKHGDKDGQPAPHPERKIEQTVLSATVQGNLATIDQQLSMSGKRAGDDGDEHTMEMTMRATDTWARQDGAWVLKSSVQKDMTVKRDGDVVFHQGS